MEDIVEFKIFSSIDEMQRQAIKSRVWMFKNHHDGYGQYQVTIISNKRYPFEINIKRNETVLDIKKTIKQTTNIDIELQTIYCVINPHSFVFKEIEDKQKYTAGDITVSAVDCPVPKVLAVFFREYINITIKYYNNNTNLFQINNTNYTQLSFKKFDTDCLIEPIAKITEEKVILESLICKKYEEKENLLIYGYLRNKQLCPMSIVQVIMEYYENEKNIIDIFKSLKYNKIDNNFGEIMLYKNMKKKYINYHDLNVNDIFNIYVIDEYGEKHTLEVTNNSTIMDIKKAFCRKCQRYQYIMKNDANIGFNRSLTYIILIYGNYIIARCNWNDKKKISAYRVGPDSTLYFQFKTLHQTYY